MSELGEPPPYIVCGLRIILEEKSFTVTRSYRHDGCGDAASAWLDDATVSLGERLDIDHGALTEVIGD